MIILMTWSSPRRPPRSNSLVCIKNYLFIVGIEPILNKELEFIFDLIVLIVRTYDNFRYKTVTQSALFFAYKNVTQSVEIFVNKM